MGESPVETAKRELKEEAGLEATNLELVGVFSGEGFYHRYPNGDEIHNIIVAYAVRGANGDMRPCGVEGEELKFFSFDSLPKSVSGIDMRVIDGLKNWLAGG